MPCSLASRCVRLRPNARPWRSFAEVVASIDVRSPPKSEAIASVARCRQAVATSGGKALAVRRSLIVVHQTEQDRGVPDLAGDARRTRFHYREPRC